MKLAKTQSDTIVNFKEKTSAKSLSNVNRYGYLFILPFLVVFLIFNIYPILRTLYLSFTKFSGYGDITFIGLDNYTRLIKDTMFWNSLLNTVKIWGINVVLQLGLAFLLTIIFSDMKYKMN